MTVDFKDFDKPQEYRELLSRAKHADASNFMLDFSHEKARCAFDIENSDLKAQLDIQRPAQYSTRWINIWAPNRQTQLIDHIAAAYGFSPRLRGLMKSKHVLNSSKRAKPRRPMNRKTSPVPCTTTRESEFVEMKHIDVERQTACFDDTEHNLMRDLNHYDIASSIYHYSSVDMGDKYFCIGYNMLHNVKPDVDRRGAHIQLGYGHPKLPHGDRIWNWLIICEDRTIISLFEDPYSSLSPTERAQIDVTKIRHNLLNVFSQLSNVAYSSNRNPISLVPIRHTDASNGDFDDRADASVDGPGLLFYYLFDDWWNTYALLTQHDHHYGAELNRLRDEMVQHPRVEHVYSLQHIGRQLACLKRLYESYENIILRVLEKQRMPFLMSQPSLATHGQSATQPSDPTDAASVTTPSGPSTVQQPNQATYSRPLCVSMPTNHFAAYPLNNYNTGALGTEDARCDSYSQYGLYLTPGARVRFERLRDRIRLYAIAEIIESIDLKDSLVTMNYNLIAVKEAGSMERLTRVTTLLSKATILFLPISLLSAYFDIAWGDPEGETIRAYWVCFAVIFVVTFSLLVLFGAMSKTLEGEVLYQPLWRIGARGWKRLRQVKGKDDDDD